MARRQSAQGRGTCQTAGSRPVRHLLTGWSSPAVSLVSRPPRALVCGNVPSPILASLDQLLTALGADFSPTHLRCIPTGGARVSPPKSGRAKDLLDFHLSPWLL